MGKTLLDKIWDRHALLEDESGRTLLYIDRLLIHENSFHAFDKLRRLGRTVRRPGNVFGFADHYVPTTDRTQGVADPENRAVIDILAKNCTEHGITHFGLDSPDQGILHVVGPELGITTPGITLAGADSHTSTHGALGCYAFGIGASDAEHILATQTIWLKKPAALRAWFDGTLREGVEAKDLILYLISRIGNSGGVGKVIEYGGPAIAALSIERRMTVCNMSIEAGARAGMIGVDDTTIDYLRDRPMLPDRPWDELERDWRQYASDPDAVFAETVRLSCTDLEPMVTWGTSPEETIPVTGTIPDPGSFGEDKQRRYRASLDYMGLSVGQDIAGTPVDKVFIGSCTNGRIEDLRRAATLLDGRQVRVPTLVVPGSMAVKRQAEDEGLDAVFKGAGAEWRNPGCSMCVATNGDLVQPGERTASTSNRNFKGRQGRGARTHLMSAGMAAAAAVRGRIVHVGDVA